MGQEKQHGCEPAGDWTPPGHVGACQYNPRTGICLQPHDAFAWVRHDCAHTPAIGVMPRCSVCERWNAFAVKRVSPRYATSSNPAYDVEYAELRELINALDAPVRVFYTEALGAGAGSHELLHWRYVLDRRGRRRRTRMFECDHCPPQRSRVSRRMVTLCQLADNAIERSRDVNEFGDPVGTFTLG